MRLRALLCDADGNLFPSEEPAFEASCSVTNRLLERLGIPERFGPDELRVAATGKNFRATAKDLAAAHGVVLADDELEEWVRDERREVVAHLRRVLAPDERVSAPLARLAERFDLAAVSSSAAERLDACFAVTALDHLFPPGVRYSAEDSLPVPTSKPDPAIYVHAARELGIDGQDSLAVEDSVTGVRSAVDAGIPVVGNLLFVPGAERSERAAALTAAGALALVGDWWELVELLEDPARLARAARDPRSPASES